MRPSCAALRVRHGCYAGVVLVLLGLSAAAESRISVSDGLLAVQSEPRGEWSLPATGDVLPAAAVFRTSGAGIVSIAADGGTLTVGPESAGRWDLRERTIALDRGRLLIDAPADAEWSASAAGIRIAAAKGAAVSIGSASGRLTCDLLRGELQLVGDAIESLTATAPASIAVEGATFDVAIPDESDWTSVAAAWAQPQPRQGPGQLLARDPQSGAMQRLNIARYHVNVVLQPPVALVQIDQSFYNPHQWQQAEGTFVFNLPAAASVSRFAMFVTHEDVIEGELIERQRADQVYTRIVHGRRDPAILEQIGDNLFRMRVFPIPARDTKRILLDYTVPLTAEAGGYRFELPLMSDLEPIWDLRLAGTIHPPCDAPTVVSPSHRDLKFTSADNGALRFELQQEHVQPEPAFSIDYRAPAESRPHVQTYRAASSGDSARRHHFVITVPPLEAATERLERAPLDVQIIADTSSGTTDLPRLRAAVRTIAAGLGENDQFQLGCADVNYRPLTSGWVAPRSSAADAALQQFDNQFPLGASMLWESISSVLKAPPAGRDGRRRIVLYLGDGASTDLPPRGDWTAASPPDGALFAAIQIGEAPATEVLLRRLVNLTGGRLFTAGHSTADWRRVLSWLLNGAPAPRRVERVTVVDGNGAPVTELFHPATWSTGQTFDVAGRTKVDGALKLTIKLADETAPREYALALPEVPSDTDVFAGRYWAQRQLDEWMSQPQSALPTDQRRKQIAALAQEWSLLCPETAFLVLEKEEDYQRWKIDRSARHRYWKPAGALAAVPLPPELRPGRGEAIQAANAAATGAGAPASPRERVELNLPPDPERFESALKAASAALERNEPARALVELVQVQPLASRLGAEPYDELWERAQAGMERLRFLEGLALHRPLLDRTTLPALPTVDPLMVSLQFGGISPEYAEIFPQAARLARQVTPPHGDVTLAEFAEFVANHSGLNVRLDPDALGQLGISGSELVDLDGLRELTLHSLLNLALKNVNQLELAYTADKSLIRITSKDVADETLETRIYPVADVVRTNVLPSPARLSDPFNDLDRAMRERVRAKLEQPVSVDFRKAPLSDVVLYFRDLLDENIRLDRAALSEEGITGNEEISLRLENVPAKIVLREAIGNVNRVALDYEIHNEVVNITRKDVVDDTLELRLYPLTGILYEIPKELIEQRQPRAFPGGFGFGGSGAAGFGFGGGGFGGGGFGGGGFGGGDAGSAPALPEDASVSVTGPPAVASEGNALAEKVLPQPTDAPDSEPSAEPVPAEIAPTDTVLGLTTGGTEPDYDQAIDLILEATEGPWQSIDGIGGVDPREYRPSLSLFVRQTRRVHEEIDDLLERLRRLPPAGALVRRARIPLITENEPAGWEMDAIIDLLLELTEGPWESVDGIGGPDPREHTPSMSLIIRQTRSVHEDIYSVLAMMRRSRAIAGRLTSARRLNGSDELARMREDLSLTDLPALPRRDGLPEPEERELQLLERTGRRLMAGRAAWRHSHGRGADSTVTLTAAEPRLQLELADHVLRADGDNAAVAYSGITLVELGAWGEAVRRIADARFPWLPHRTNRELAQLFDIRLEQETDEGLTLRLDFPGAPDARLLIQSAADGQPRRMEAWFDGARQYELQFEYDPAEPGSPSRVTSRDAHGAVREQWDRTASDSTAIVPPLAEEWGDFVVDDPAGDESPYRRARAALARYDYAEAGRILSDAVADRPHQALFNLLLAWVDEFGGHPPTVRIKQRVALEAVVRSGAFDLARTITALNFPSLSDRDLYELLLAVPDERRSAWNYDELAVLAAALDRQVESLAHVEAALARTPGTAGEALRDRQLDRIAALLRLGRTSTAVDVANDLLAPRHSGLNELARIGDVFGSAGHTGLAEDYFARAREKAAGDPSARAELLQREARWHAGARRWRILLEAADLHANDVRSRDALIRIVIGEMSSPDDAIVAGLLAREFPDSPISTPLKIREAELTNVRIHAADIAVELYSAGRLPADRFAWMIGTASKGRRHADVIRILEAKLRTGLRLDTALRQHLARAYRSEQRNVDAERTESDAQEPTPGNEATTGSRGGPATGLGFPGFF